MRSNKTSIVSLGDVIAINPDSLKVKDCEFSYIEYIDISSVGSGVLMEKKVFELKNAPSRARRLVKSYDTILSTVRPNLRAFLLLKKTVPNLVVSTGFAVLRATSKIDKRFLYYTVTNQEFTDYLTVNAKGAAYPAVDVDTIKRAKINLPPLPTQHKIAAILSAYDDLIENNNRRIEILEEMARMLYREWFVKFRYPGHESDRFYESELGLIPEGWEVKSFADIADFVNGFAFKPQHWKTKGKPIIKIAELKNGITQKTPFYDGDDIPKKCDICQGDILFSWSASLDAFIWRYGPALLNQHIFKVNPKEKKSKLFVYFALQEKMEIFRLLSQGTTMRHIKRAALQQVFCAVPPTALITKFEKFASDLIAQVLNLTSKNNNLRQTRDLLLPRLISGEIDVENLDIKIGNGELGEN